MLGASVGTSGKKTQLEADERLGGQAWGSDATAGQWGADAEGKRLALPRPVPRLRSAACGHSPSEQGPPLGPGLGPSSDKLAQKPGAGPMGAATGSPCQLIHRQKPRRATMPAVALPGPGPGPQDSRSAGGMPYLEEVWEGRETQCGQAPAPGDARFLANVTVQSLKCQDLPHLAGTGTRRG